MEQDKSLQVKMLKASAKKHNASPFLSLSSFIITQSQFLLFCVNIPFFYIEKIKVSSYDGT